MERDSFGLPIKRVQSSKVSDNRVKTIQLNQPPRLLSAPVRKAINPFIDRIPPKPRNPFDDDNDDDNDNNKGISDLRISEIFSSTHSNNSYKQVRYNPSIEENEKNEKNEKQMILTNQQNNVNNGSNIDNLEEGQKPQIGEGENEIEESKEDVDQVPHVYRLSQDRQSSRQNFRNIMLKAERSKFKRGFGEEICAVDKDDDNAVIRFLLSQRTFGYPGTDGTFFENYVAFVLNQHPLLGLVFHHRLHPYRTRDRIIIFLCLLAFSFAISVALLDDFYFKEKFICSAGCDTMRMYNHTSGPEICVGGENDGMKYSDYRKHCKYYHSWIISLGAAAIICPYGSLLKFLATCQCVQGRSFYQKNCIGRALKQCFEYIGNRILIVFIVINLILFCIALYYAYVVMRMYTVLATFLLSKLFSYVYWFGWTGPYFSYRYTIDQKAFYKELRKRKSKSKSSSNMSLNDEIEMSRINSDSRLLGL